MRAIAQVSSDELISLKTLILANIDRRLPVSDSVTSTALLDS